MSNIPDIFAHDREIPAGKVLLAEYRDLTDDDLRPETFVLDTKTGWGRTEVKLVARTAGFACAGSMARWDNGHFAVEYWIDNARHGRRYRSFDDAWAHFNRIPSECPYAAYEAAHS